MIEVAHVAKRYAQPHAPFWERARRRAVERAAPRPRWIDAVHDISFAAPDGRITALLGPNGAGKTTTLRMIVGLVRPDRGEVRIDGVPVAGHAEQLRATLGVLTDGRGLYPRLTARENVRYHARLHGMTDDRIEARIDALAQQLGMQALLDRRCDGFSQGERMKTALARALVHGPRHLLLDEPTNGLDVPSTRALRSLLADLRDQGLCIVLCTHVMQEVERLADALVVVRDGRVAATGDAQTLKAAAGTQDLEAVFMQLAYGAAA